MFFNNVYNKKLLIILGSIISFILILVAVFSIYFGNYYHAVNVDKYLESNDKVLVNGYLYKDSFGNGKGKELKDHVGAITLTSTKKNTTKPYHIDLLGWVDEKSIIPYTPTPKEDVKDDCSLSCEDMNTLKKLLEFLSKLIKLLKDLFKGK